MKRIIALLFIVCGFAAVAYAQSTKTALQTQIANCFPTQTVGAITPPITVGCMNAIIASMQQYAGVNAQTTTSYTVLQSDYGQLVTFSNAAAISTTLPQPISSSFYPFNVFLRNIGAGPVNLLPVGSTVNSATTLQLLTGQSVWLVSDNANWQAWSVPSSSVFGGLTTFTGQFFPAFGTPTISTGTCGFGTNGTLATSSVNQSGKIVIGASATTSCSVSFSQTLTQTPIACTFAPAGAPVALAATWQISSVNIQTISNTQFTLAGNALASTNWYYHCF